MKHNFYKPSGKISPAFFLYLLLSAVFIIPIFGFLQALIFFYSPVMIINLLGVAFCLILVTSLGGTWCVEKGKVRNKRIASFSAIFCGLLFMYLFVVFYCAFFENHLQPMEIAEFIVNPSRLSESIESILNEGISVLIRRIKRPVRIRGIILTILWGIDFLLTQIIFLIAFRDLAGKPFVEKKKQWAKEIALEFEYIEDKIDLLDKMVTGNPDYITRLPVLQVVNVSYSSFELYPGEDNYYLSVYNHRAKAPNEKGEVTFETDNLFEYLFISKQTGDMLLAKQVHQNRKQVNAKIVSKRTRKAGMFSLVQSVALGGVFIWCMIQAYRSGQIGENEFPPATVVFCTAALVVFYVLSAIGSFVKEDVIVLENIMYGEDWRPADALTNMYRIERKDLGLFYKVFNILMSVISIGFLAYTIYFNWGMNL